MYFDSSPACVCSSGVGVRSMGVCLGVRLDPERERERERDRETERQREREEEYVRVLKRRAAPPLVPRNAPTDRDVLSGVPPRLFAVDASIEALRWRFGVSGEGLENETRAEGQYEAVDV